MKIAVGTEKGAYVLDSATGGVDGPHFPGWKVNAFGITAEGTHLAGLGSNWFGAAVHRSSDFESWEQASGTPSYSDETDLNNIWTFHNIRQKTLVGVADAGLFVSDDDGLTWEGVESLNDHRTRSEWGPGLGGLCAHRILSAGDSIWVAISAVGVFRSDDGGVSWEPKNDGVPMAGVDEQPDPRPEVGYCVHNLDHDPAHPERLFRQDHAGVFRSDNGGDAWDRIENGLPAGFGFVMRRDHASGRLFTLPLHSDGNRVPVDGKLAMYRSDDDGDSWQVSGSGWPDSPTYTSVLRGAVDADGDGTLAFGTTGGKVWLTDDAGENWRELDATVPRIGAVRLI